MEPRRGTGAAREVALIGAHTEDILLRRMTAQEELGRLYRFELEVLSAESNLAFSDYLGRDMTVRLDLPEGGRRYFHGFVSRFGYAGVERAHDRDYTLYRVVLRPWLWFLTRSADCRIFQDKTVPEIILEVFRDAGFTDFEDALEGEYRTWDYCVQYRETHHDFVSRLMEQEGIYYWIRHEEGRHTVVLSDAADAHQAAEGYETVPYRRGEHGDLEEGESITTWNVSQVFQPGVFTLSDFDFTKPRTDLTVRSTDPDAELSERFEVFDYPGEYSEQGDGEHYVRSRLEESVAEHERSIGDSTARGLGAGHKFTFEEHPREDQNREYLIVSAVHVVTSNDYATSESPDREPVYAARIEAMSNGIPFRLKPTTRKPIVQGPQTAIVVGPDGEEIHADEYGRVKVHFHWDRHNPADENASCWIRVGQTWAGKEWGRLVVPRIGTEVIVDFLEGDPDRPIITGQVYNQACMPPYDPSEHGTVTTLKGNSSKGGDGFNEFRFEDKKGEEQVFLHAEKDEDVRVKNDAREWIGNDRHLIVEGSQKEKVKESKHTTVSGDRMMSVGGDSELKVKGDRVAEAKSDHLTVGGDQFVKVKGERNIKVAKDLLQETEGHCSLDVGGNLIFNAKGELGLEAEGGVIGVESFLKIHGKQAVSLEVGGSHITVGQDAVVIKAPRILLNCGYSVITMSAQNTMPAMDPEAPGDPAGATEAASQEIGAIPRAAEDPEPPRASGDAPQASGAGASSDAASDASGPVSATGASAGSGAGQAERPASAGVGGELSGTGEQEPPSGSGEGGAFATPGGSTQSGLGAGRVDMDGEAGRPQEVHLDTEPSDRARSAGDAIGDSHSDASESGTPFVDDQGGP